MNVPMPISPVSAKAPASTVGAPFPALTELPGILAAAPHRLMFFAGAAAVLVSLLWWACYLAAGYLHLPFPDTRVPAGWAHAVMTQFGMLPLFMFGFLLTVFPRWLRQPALTRRHYVPVFAAMFAGYLLAHVGLLGHQPLLVAGLALMLGGWLYALFVLGGVLLRSDVWDWYALSCYLALMLGACGLASFMAFLLGAPWRLAFVAIRLGTFGLLLPVFFTVCHRMIPFFSANVVGPRYRIVRPLWSLALAWPLLVVHMGLDLHHDFDWLWTVDVPLTLLFGIQWLAWQPWKCLKPGLLAALYVAFAWLPIAFAMFAVQSLILHFNGTFVLGRAPVHALTIGFFGSMLVAMVTRVTMGHSGRPLQMGAAAWLTFGLLQLVALSRIYAEVATDASLWLIIAAFGWVLAFLPWVLHSVHIYATPRVDGRPG